MNRSQPLFTLSALILALFTFGASAATVEKKTTTVTKIEEPDTRRGVDNSRPERVEADNSKLNNRESLTAGDQSLKRSDTDITAAIRRAIVADDVLSTYAHNVKIITKDGRVTLKGPVRSQAEKTKVGRLASQAAGQAKVSNFLDIRPSNKEGE